MGFGFAPRLREWARGDGGERAQRAQPVGMTELVDGLVRVRVTVTVRDGVRVRGRLGLGFGLG